MLEVPEGRLETADTAAARDVIFTFSYVSWAGAQRRGMNFAQDRLVARLIAEPRVDRLLVANPYRSLPRRLARAVLRRAQDPAPPPSERVALHEPGRLRRVDPTSLRAIERAYRRYDEQLRRAAERAGLDRPAVVTMHPLIAGFAPLEWASSVVFYCTDDWSAAPAYRPWWPAYREGYARIRGRGRTMIAVSQPIVDRVQPTGAWRVIPNGVDAGEWLAPGPAPAWFAALPAPRFLYLGTLDSRLDVPAVQRLAERFSGGSIVLAGTMSEPAHLAPLEAHANVHVVPRQDRALVPGLVHAADVCLITHRRTPFTEAMSPLKAYEYLAGGRPVVATDLPPLRGIDDRLLRYVEGDDVAAVAHRALELGPASEDERRRFVADNAWARRHEQVLDLVLGDPS